MFKIGDQVRIRIVNSWKAGSLCLNRNGEQATVQTVADYYEEGDKLHILVQFKDGRSSGTHAMNLVNAHGPCPMEYYHGL